MTEGLDEQQLSHELFSGGGEMGARMRAFDWQRTPLGPVERWPAALVSTLSICLSARFPMAIYWAREGFLFYNDAWRPILGDKHPWALGRTAREVWPEIWDAIGPLLSSVLTTGEATWRGDELLPMQRFGYTEECYFDYTFNPIRGQTGSIEGILNVVQETTYRVLNDRRAQLLRELAARSGAARSEKEACDAITSCLATDAADIPFALLYLVEPDGQSAHLAGATGPAVERLARTEVVDLAATDSWPLAAALRNGKQITVDLAERFGLLPGGFWPEPVTQAVVLPVGAMGPESVAALLVAGVNPRHQLDDDYRHFFEMVASQIVTALTNARAYSSEKRRAEALAELDRAKTNFFSNVSHEFRTPLTLMLGPLADVLAKNKALPAADREELEVAHRNGRRLLKLVNTLLDFSRLEAGRMQAVYEPIDLAAFTTELASVFRSTVEKAGLRLIVNCQPLGEAVYIDREMWEKIVFNLLSNAFKFTFEGEIEVGLRIEEDEARQELATLTVRDTGTGIPAEELPHLFERFHRVKGVHGRTFEGSGIGLALVQELVKLHGGRLRVASEVNRGSSFVVSIPFGTAHLPAERVSATRTNATSDVRAYAEEVSHWLPEGDRQAINPEDGADGAVRQTKYQARVLLADDNADMREYVGRLLNQTYEVVMVGDGEEALRATRTQPFDLVLADVMMPRLDGFGLLRELRANERTKTLPVILLSARAGEEARIEGIEAGADDYLVKPFSAKELLARVEARLEITRVRREAEAVRREADEALRRGEERYRNFVAQSSEGIWRFEVDPPAAMTLSPDEMIGYFYQHAYLAECNDAMARMYGYEAAGEIVGARPDDLLPPSDPANLAYLRAFIAAGYRLTEAESREPDRAGNVHYFLNNLVGVAEDGRLARIWGTQRDVTESRQAEEALRESEERYRTLFESIDEGFSIVEMLFDEHGRPQDYLFLDINAVFEQLTGLAGAIGKTARQLVPSLEDFWFETYGHVALTGESVRFENYSAPMNRWFDVHASRIGGAESRRVAIIFTNITERKRTDQVLRESEARFRNMADHAPVMVWMTEPDGSCTYLSQSWYEFTGQTPETGLGLGWLDATHPDDTKEAERIFLDANRRRAPFRLEYRLRRRDGFYAWAIDSAQPRFSADNEFLGFIGSVIDITERKEAEESLREAMEREQTLRNRAEEANRLKDEFLATVSHELRTPLTAILGWSHMLRAKRLDEAGHARALETIERNARSQQQLVEDLLDVSRIITGKLRLNVRPCDPASFIEAAVEAVRPAAEAKAIRLQKVLDPGAISIAGDPARLQQVVWNLLANAIKFTPKGGRVQVRLERVNSHVEVVVTDTGAGIDVEFLPHVFDRFRQADGSTTRAHGGLGLGLAIVRHLVELHGGTVEADSAGLGRGATFTVKLPLISVYARETTDERVHPRAGDAPLSPIEDSERLDGLKVLVVDDEVDSCELLQAMLAQCGVEVVTALSAAEGLAAIERFRPDVLISDIGMPQTDGYELMRRLRSLPAERGGKVPAIALTAYARVEDRLRALRAGYQMHVPKPVEATELIAVVASLAGRSNKK